MRELQQFYEQTLNSPKQRPFNVMTWKDVAEKYKELYIKTLDKAIL